jgi:hypothetical protein
LNSPIEQNFAIVFPLFFAALLLTVTAVLAALSGWFRLSEISEPNRGAPHASP